MSQSRAHLTVFGRQLLVERVVEQGWPVGARCDAHIASR